MAAGPNPFPAVLTPWITDFNIPAQCRRFVRRFARRVAGDALLGRAFPSQRHPPAEGEYAWWEQALTGSHYTGRPLHREAGPPFTASQIGRWCSLLEESLYEAFGSPAASEVKGHVLNLATMLAHWQLNYQGTDTGQNQSMTALAA